MTGAADGGPELSTNPDAPSTSREGIRRRSSPRHLEAAAATGHDPSTMADDPGTRAENDLEERLARLEAQAAEAPPPTGIDRAFKFLPYIAIAHVAIGAPTLILTLLLAYATFVQADATRKMQQGGALPIIAYGTSNATDEGEAMISLDLANYGVGPALLGPLEMRYQGAPVRTPRELLERCCGLEAGQPVSFSTSPTTGIAVRPGDTVSFFRLPRSAQNQAIWDRLNVERWKLEVHACYCSIFEDCWVVEGMQSRPRPADSCPASPNAYAADLAPSTPSAAPAPAPPAS